MKKNNKAKIIIAVLTLIMALVNVILFNVYAVEEKDTQVKNTKVYFDVYLMNNNQKTYKAFTDADSKYQLYFNLKVEEGYLKTPEIAFGDTNINLLETDFSESKTIENIDFKNKKISLKTISKGEEITFKLPITMIQESKYNIKNLNKKTQIFLNGTYLNNKSETIQIKNEERNLELYLNKENIKSNLERKITKYIQTDKNVIIEEEIISNIENNVLPVKETIITVDAPVINGIKPENVYVYVDSSNSTNGRINTGIKENDLYEYNKEKNIITIKFENEPDENGIISWEKEAQDKVTITYIYEKSATGKEITNNVTSKIKVYNYSNENQEISKTIDDSINLEEKGEEVSISINIPNKSINKGYLYGNAEKIEYTENYSVDISNISQQGLEIKSEGDKYINKDDSEQSVESYYIKTTIEKNNFINILGENGQIQILDENNNIIDTINKNSEVAENNKFVIKYNKEVKNIKINTSAPIKIGKLEIENTKYLTNTKLTKEDIEKINRLQDNASVKTEQIKHSFNYSVILIEPTTKINTKINTNINNKNLSALKENENVEFQVELNTQNSDEKLFVNPEIRIQLPSYVENLKINNVKVIHSDEIEVNKDKYEYDSKTKTIIVKLDGTQTKHNATNTVIGIYADIVLDKMAQAKEDKIKVVTINGTDEVTKNISIKVISANGLVILNEVTDVEKQQKIVNTSENEIKIENLQVNSKQKEILIERTIGNYGDKINKLEVKEELYDRENAFNAILTGQVKTTSGKVEYLENNSQTWKENVEDYSKVTAFRILVEEETAKSIKIGYNIVPQNLKYNAKSNIKTTVSYQIEGQEINKQVLTKLSSEVKSQEEQSTETIKNDEIRYEKQYEKMKVRVAVSANNNIVKASDTVREGQYLKYVVEITNTSSETLKNINLKLTAENGKYYALARTGHSDTWEVEQVTDESGIDYGLRSLDEVDNYEKIIDEISPNQKITYSYQMIVNEDAENKKIVSNIQILQENKEIDTIKIANDVISSKLKLTVRYGHSDNLDAVADDAFGIIILAKNISNEDLKNITISIKLPDVLKVSQENLYEEDKQDSNFDEKKVEGNTVYYTLNKLNAGEENKIILLTDVIMEANLSEIQVNLQANAKVDNEEYISNEFIKTIYQDIILLDAKQEGSISQETVKDGEKLNYIFTIVNNGKEKVDNIKIQDILPDGVRLYDIIIKQNNKEIKSDVSSISYASISDISLESGEKVIIELYTIVTIKDIKDNSNELSNYAIISHYDMDDIKTNTITYKINTDGKSNNSNNNSQDSNNQNNDSSNNSENYNEINTISGLAWFDENKNGSRENGETLLSGISVKLIDEENQNIIQTTITSTDGTYKFRNVENGKYVVQFEYDNLTYSLTTYQKANVSNDLNSDVIEVKDSFDNKIYITDTITIKDNNIKNIDIGLIKITKFDLKLDKYISSVTIQNKQGVKTYTYTEQKLAKIEIPEKYMDGSKIIVEYTIAVKNEGDITGNIKKIVDYIPSDLKFNSELNKNWYMATDGYVYNTSLSEIDIKPGESIDTQLVLTKTINSTDSELITNMAEISEDYNTLGLEDIDSVVNNKNEAEDDISTAELIISIKTGKILRNSLIAIVIILIFAIGIYKIKKINNGKEKKNE